MKSRWIAVVVCALFLAASTLAPVLHHHEDSTAAHEGGCAACAWHHYAHVDVPCSDVSLESPTVPVQAFEEVSVPQSWLIATDHFGRGPPLFS